MFPWKCSSLLLLVGVIQQVSSAKYDETLVQTHVVYRHGDRAPVVTYPNDLHTESDWPHGLGHLTDIGRQQQTRLGQFLRAHYDGFINKTYDPDEFRVMSSDIDRCLISAYSNLAGLYGESAVKWNLPYISWQPLPVHTVDVLSDVFLAMDRPCKKADEEKKRLSTESAAAKQINKDYKEFFSWLYGLTGDKYEEEKAFANVWRVSDTVFCEKTHNMTTPKWLELTNITCSDSKLIPCKNKTVYHILRDISSLQMATMFNSTLIHKFDGGPLMENIARNMKDYDPKNITTQKFHMYSAHDTTVAALLSALGAYDGESPQYTATVIMELHNVPKKPGKLQVKLYYKKVTDSKKLTALSIAGCPGDCYLDDFENIAKKSYFNVSQWDSECGNNIVKPSPTPSTSIKLTHAELVLIIICSAVVLCLIIITVLCHIKRRKISQNYQRLSQHS